MKFLAAIALLAFSFACAAVGQYYLNENARIARWQSAVEEKCLPPQLKATRR